MSNRDYKDFAQGNFYHIYNRGNNKETIFLENQDYKAFLYRLGLTLGFDAKDLSGHIMTSVPNSRVRISDMNREDFKIHSFCLMSNHFHILIEQCKEISVSKLVLKLCSSYSWYINSKYKKVGHVFQDCFKANHVSGDSQLMWTSAYIHMNPVKDGLVNHPSEYIWSSYNDFVKNRKLPITHTHFLNSIFDNTENFEKETLNFDVKGSL